MYKSARKEAGFSIQEAAWQLHVGSRTLTNYEQGYTIPPPEVVLNMVKLYNCPELTAKYCAKICPIGQVYAHCYERNNMATTVLSLLKEFTDVEKLKDKLIAIACDNRLDESEIPEFRDILKEAIELEKAIGELKQWAEKHDIKIEEIMRQQKEKDAIVGAI